MASPAQPPDDVPARSPLLEFDPEPDGVIAPRPLRTTEPFPDRAVLCFFHDVLTDRESIGQVRRIGAFGTEIGGHPVLVVDTPAGPVAAFHPGVGAPLAAVHLEVAIAAGVRSVVACGGAGAVRPGLALGHVVVPSAAVRDEGTSHHYRLAARRIDTDPEVVGHLISVLVRHDRPHSVGPTWTTDAIYRETAGRIARRRDEGCLTVEMETAALAAVADLRGVRFGQYLYAGDDVSGPTWDHRRWTRAQVRGELFDLAVEAVATLPPSRP